MTLMAEAGPEGRVGLDLAGAEHGIEGAIAVPPALMVQKMGHSDVSDAAIGDAVRGLDGDVGESFGIQGEALGTDGVSHGGGRDGLGDTGDAHEGIGGDGLGFVLVGPAKAAGIKHAITFGDGNGAGLGADEVHEVVDGLIEGIAAGNLCAGGGPLGRLQRQRQEQGDAKGSQPAGRQSNGKESHSVRRR